jgi:uncharacterized membrane protein YphA (DoxX/SURF4 family)
MPGAPDHSTTTKLPPPPAPVARDANPWPMPQRQGETRVRAERPRSAKYPLPPPPDPMRSPRHGLSRFVPLAVFLVILGSVASGALEALGRGDRLGAIVPLIVLGVAAVSVWRSARRRNSRASGVSNGGQGDR